jgi:lysophospholipase L1-like esterase
MKLSQFTSAMKQTLIIFLITFGMTEATFRIYSLVNPTFIFYDSSYNRYRGKPLSPSQGGNLNSQGFRGAEYTQVKPANTYRIISLGDSFTFGIVPVQYNYNSRIERQLNRKLTDQGKQFQLINMGIPGIGPREYLALLTNEGIQLNPDMVMVSLFIGNDLLEAERGMDKKREWYSYSYVLSFLNYAITIQKKYEGKAYGVKNEYVDNKPSLEAGRFLEIQSARHQIFVKGDTESSTALNNQVEYIKQMKKICDSKNIKFLVVMIPDENQINPELQQQIMAKLKVDSQQIDIKQPNQALATAFTQAQIPYLDLLDTFITGSKQELLYKPQDTHWNIAGNRVAAQAITPKIIEQIK